MNNLWMLSAFQSLANTLDLWCDQNHSYGRILGTLVGLSNNSTNHFYENYVLMAEVAERIYFAVMSASQIWPESVISTAVITTSALDETTMANAFVQISLIIDSESRLLNEFAFRIHRYPDKDFQGCSGGYMEAYAIYLLKYRIPSVSPQKAVVYIL